MKVMIIGCGLSGLAVKDYLDSQKIETFFLPDEMLKVEKMEEKELDRLFDDLSFIIVSPGVSMQNYIIFQAKKRKIAIFGELEFGATRLNCNIIAVTGTNGKTTTVSLINHLLKDYDKNVFLGGNIGVAVSKFIGKTQVEDIAILECSSFQLETIKNFHPHIAAITNISEDHLNRHKTMADYIKCKFNITKNQTENDYLILNGDDELLFNNPLKTNAKILYFSTKKKVVGCYLKNKSIYFNDNQNEIKIGSLSGLKLVGEHNKSNVLCACLICYLQTKNSEFIKNLKTFIGVAHRIEFVNKINGVSFYNDSKATNIDSTIVATKSFNNDIGLILGGSDKGYDFDDLFKNLKSNVKNIAIFGETKYKIASSAKKFNFKNFYICENLDSATRLLFRLSKPNDIVLLSPACASFDFFSNYEERGNFFKKIVREIESYENDSNKFKEKTQI